MKTPRSVYQISRKSVPKGRHIYHPTIWTWKSEPYVFVLYPIAKVSSKSRSPLSYTIASATIKHMTSQLRRNMADLNITDLQWTNTKIENFALKVPNIGIWPDFGLLKTEVFKMATFNFLWWKLSKCRATLQKVRGRAYPNIYHQNDHKGYQKDYLNYYDYHSWFSGDKSSF